MAFVCQQCGSQIFRRFIPLGGPSGKNGSMVTMIALCFQLVAVKLLVIHVPQTPEPENASRRKSVCRMSNVFVGKEKCRSAVFDPPCPDSFAEENKVIGNLIVTEDDLLGGGDPECVEKVPCQSI